MLAHPTHERLLALGLAGMAKAFEEQRNSPDLGALSFEERVAIMADREAAERDTKRMTARLKFAALRQDACVEDIDLRTPRGIDRVLLARLVAGDWIDRRHARLLKTLARIDLLEILEDRNGRGATLVTSQVPVEQWHEVIGEPTLADAILDRLVHNAHRLNMTGDSMRRITGRRALDAGLSD